jgi:hypothetical protein
VRKLASTIAKWSAVLGMAEYAERFAEERIEIDSWFAVLGLKAKIEAITGACLLKAGNHYPEFRAWAADR